MLRARVCKLELQLQEFSEKSKLKFDTIAFKLVKAGKVDDQLDHFNTLLSEMSESK